MKINCTYDQTQSLSYCLQNLKISSIKAKELCSQSLNWLNSPDKNFTIDEIHKNKYTISDLILTIIIIYFAYIGIIFCCSLCYKENVFIFFLIIFIS